MDRVSRLILVLLLAFVPAVASAGYTCSFSGSTGTHPTDSAQAYGVMVAAFNARKVPFGATCNPTGAYYQKLRLVSASPPVFRSQIEPMGSCAASPEFDIACSGSPDDVQCPSNQERDPATNTCQCKDIPAAGKFMVSGDEYTGCNNGCSMVLKSGWFDKTNNVTWGDWGQPGSSCTVADKTVISNSDPKVEAAKQCAAGTCPGTVNGQSVCVPCDKTKQTEASSSSTSASTTASGATSSTTTTDTESGTSRTECKDGQCTTRTTTTTTGANGDKTDKTTTTSEPQSDYCTRNPKADVCKGTESSWGGTCGAFSCDGDAVQCAQAKAGWELACGLKVDETNPLIGVGQQATAGGDRPSDHPGNQANTIALDLSSRLSSVPLFGTSGDCIADKSVTFMGKGYTLPFSKWCPYLNILGSAFLAACYLAAAFIIFRD